jgi:thiamine-phosphate pyrophosphorylase
VIDVGLCVERGLDPATVADACLRGGARWVQLRQKSGSDAAFLALAERIAASARDCGAALIVNDRADIARLSGAIGVHVGQDDLSVADVRTLLTSADVTGGDAAQAVVGISTHDIAQIDAAVRTDATYIAVGPIYGTLTKATGYTARGLDLVQYAASRGKPVVAIGGITLERAPAVIAAGASAVAVITDVLAGGDPEQRTRQFLSALGVRSPI